LDWRSFACHKAGLMKKKKRTTSPTRSKMTVLRQMVNLIPPHLIPRLARETGVDKQSRDFDPNSHVIALMNAQLTHSIGLNDVCDSLELHQRDLSTIRGAKPPRRNTFSHANRTRDPAMAERLFWETLQHLQSIQPDFAHGRRGKGLLRRFRRNIYAMDSTVIELVANCMDWAQHRRRKAAAKCHLRLNLQSFLPSVAIVDTARDSDAKRARELTAGLKSGEIGIFDKAYVDFAHLADLDRRGVIWVSRAKENMAYKVKAKLPVDAGSKVVRDELVWRPQAKKGETEVLRRVEAWVEVDGQERLMVFVTNQLDWSPQTIVDLYRCRWAIEVFFKQIKQTLQLADFLGHNATAVRWQVWTALLVYVLLRFQAHVSQWPHSFTRLFTLVRAALWKRLELRTLLERYGTAGGSYRMLGAPEQAYLPGFG
jgi:hypothetical protein